MDKKTIERIAKDCFDYRASFPYFGDASSNALCAAYSNAKMSGGIARLSVGQIAWGHVGNVFTKLMSCNPRRWGGEDLFCGSIKKFCDNPKNSNGITGKLFQLLNIVSGKTDVCPLKRFVNNTNGELEIYLKYNDKLGKMVSGDNYNLLRLLFQCVKIICKQNALDFIDADDNYRNEMMRLENFYPRNSDKEILNSRGFRPSPDMQKIIDINVKILNLTKTIDDNNDFINDPENQRFDPAEVSYLRRENDSLNTDRMLSRAQMEVLKLKLNDKFVRPPFICKSR